MRTQRPTRGEAQLITMILSMLYRNKPFPEDFRQNYGREREEA